MIVFVRTANINPGRLGQSIAFNQALLAHLKQQHDVTLEVLMPVAGNPNRMAWSARYKDLAALEALRDRLAGDTAYWALLEENAPNFQAGTVHDAIWKAMV